MASPVAERRLKLRDTFFPDSQEKTWNRKANTGFCTLPRLLPYVMGLMRDLAEKKGDPSMVYFDLWARAFDEGMASITDESAAAFASGYTGSRAVRTWRERMKLLEELGFIETRAAGNRPYAHILLVNPINVVCELRVSSPEKVPDTFWNAFIARAQEIGADLPDLRWLQAPPGQELVSTSAN